jgi:hypothetical protein
MSGQNQTTTKTITKATIRISSRFGLPYDRSSRLKMTAKQATKDGASERQPRFAQSMRMLTEHTRQRQRRANEALTEDEQQQRRNHVGDERHKEEEAVRVGVALNPAGPYDDKTKARRGQLCTNGRRLRH